MMSAELTETRFEQLKAEVRELAHKYGAWVSLEKEHNKDGRLHQVTLVVSWRAKELKS